MNKKILSLAFLAAVSSGAWAHDDRTPHYLAFELPTPDLADPQCVAGYATSNYADGLNNRRFAAGGASCYHDYGTTPEGRPSFATVTKPSAWSPLTGAYLLPGGREGLALAVDDFSNTFGFLTGITLDGVKWTPGGDSPLNLFPVDPTCGWGISFATGGNARGEAVGWGVRPVPGDPLGCNIRPVVRKASGEEVLGPSGGTPSTITNSGIVALSLNSHAAKWNSRTGEVVQLRPDSDTESSGVVGITERGVAIGSSNVIQSLPPAEYCYTSKALVWDARNRERVLPNPPGAVASSPYAINEDEIIVGYSTPSACRHPADQVERATIWIDGRALDLNRLVIGRPGIVLLQALAINDRGEISAYGYRAWEPKKPCPQTVIPPPGEVSYSDDSVCRDTRAYLLVPID